MISVTIAAAHVKSLLSLPVINKETATDLRAWINQFQGNLNAIKALDLSITLREVLSQILIEHVDEVTSSTRAVGEARPV